MSPRPALAAVLALGLGGCAEPESPPSEALTVVATFSVLGDLVHQVGGEDIDLSILAPAGSDAHNFLASPRHFATVGRADLLFAVGAGFEPWLLELLRGSGFRGSLVETSRGLDLIRDRRGEPDPHVWLDVRQAAAMVVTIRDALVAADPRRRDGFHQRASTVLLDLEELDEWIARAVEAIPRQRRIVVTGHGSAAYYARRYGIEIVGTVLHSHSTETGEPSAAHLAHLVREMRRKGAVAVFPEDVYTSHLLERLAAEAGVVLGPPLLTGSLGQEESTSTYVGMMRRTTQSLVETLR